MHKKLALFGIGATAFLAERMNQWCRKTFPAEPLKFVSPRPGYKVFGYMGCPASKINKICKRERLLFFAETTAVPQKYALRNTSWWSRLQGRDAPVVLQLEIREDFEMSARELWRDQPSSKRHPFMGTMFVSCWPALPPKTQETCDLQVRVHHVVTCAVQQEGGHCCRAIHALWRKLFQPRTHESAKVKLHKQSG